MSSILQILFSIAAASLGIVFNGYILFVFIWNRKIQTANRLLLLHLAFVDTLFCLVILFYNTSLSAVLGTSLSSASYHNKFSALETKVFRDTSESHWCNGHGFFWTLLPLVLVWNVCGLSCDRYAAIFSPLHYSRLINTKRVLYFILSVWCTGVLFASGPLVGICPYTFWEAKWACTANCLSSKTIDLGYAITYTIIAIILPISIILLCNFHMLVISKYHRHNIASAIYEVTLKAQATVTHQTNPNYLSRFKGKNAFFTIAQVVGSLTVFILPYHVVLLWEAANGRTCNEILASITTILLTCSPSINAYVYGVKSRMLRETVKRLLQQHFFKNGHNKTIRLKLSEIFSEHVQHPQLSRRMSAPPEYGRKSSVSNLPNTANEVSDMKPKRTKKPFLRSISLPIHAWSGDLPPVRKISNSSTRDNVSSKRSPKSLPRGESAPEEDITPCDLITDDIPNDSQRTSTSSRYSNKMLFSRSSSYPTTQEPTFKNAKVRKLMALRRQQAIELDEGVYVVELSPEHIAEHVEHAEHDNVLGTENAQNIFQVSHV